MSHSQSTRHSAEDDLLQRARKRVDMKRGFYIHALVFTLVNLGLYLLHGVSGGHGWRFVPIWGWAIGLAAHGVVTFVSLRGEGLYQRMLDQEIETLRQQGR